MGYFAYVSSEGGCGYCIKVGSISKEELTEEEFKNENKNWPTLLESKYFEFKTKADRNTFKENVINLYNFKRGRSYGKEELQNFLKIYPELLIYIS
jgi:hypothetical protein